MAAARGCRRCLGLLLRGQEPQSGRSLAQGEVPEVSPPPWEQSQTQGVTSSPSPEPRWPRRALSFLTEDGSDGGDTGVALGDIPEAGALSSTRRSLLDGPGDSAVPWGWPDCPQEPRGDSAVPWRWPDCPQEPRGDSAVPLPPLASSTLLWDGDQPPSGVLGTRTRGPPSASLGDVAVPCPRFAGGVSPRRHQGGDLGTRAVSPRSPPPRGGFSGRSVAPQSWGDTAGDIPWGRAAVPDTAVTEPGHGDPAGLGDSGGFGDSTESFVTARESLGGAPGGAAPAPNPTPADLGRDLGLGRDSGQGLGRDLGQGLGRDLGQGLGRDLGQGLGRDLGRDLGLGQDLGLGLGQDLEQNLNLGQDLGLGRDSGQDLGLRPDLGRDLCLRPEGSRAIPQIPWSPRAVGALLARPGGCDNLGGSPGGRVTPRGCDSLGDRHVTPRSGRRLRAAAARFCSSSSSSSSSLLPDTPPVSPRVPRVAVTPPGHRVTPGDRDVAAAGREGTGGSWGDSQIVPGLSPRGGGVPKAGPGVLRGLGDKGHPQNCSGSHSRGFGDKGYWQTSLSPSRGSPDASAALRPLLGNRRHPQESPRVTRGVPGATSEPGGGSGWQRPSPLGTSPVPLSPSCATCRAESHQEDVTQDLAPRECHSPGGTDATGSPGDVIDATGSPGGGTDATSSPGGGSGRGGHMALRDNLSPVIAWEQQRWPQGYSPELVAALRTGRVPDCAQDELALTADFERPEQGQRWPGGRLKSSFNYLLLDPRVTQDLPRRSPGLSPAERFRTFVAAVFYVGKGTRARPWWHLHQALAQHRRGTQRGGPKVRRIVSLWAAGQGVVALQCFQHRVPAEALTRESCMLQALGLQALTNARGGPCYGVAAAWPGPRRRRLGVLLLHRAMGVLLAEGESHIYPGDVPGVTHSTLR